MRGFFPLFLGASLLGFGSGAAQTPPQPVGRDLQVQLTAGIKAKKAKVGDTVSAVTVVPITFSQGLVVPAGSKVIGHLRQVEADSAQHTSFIALSFDEIGLKSGEKIALKCFVRAALLPAMKGTAAQDAQQGQTMAPMQVPARGGMMNGGMGGGMGGGMRDAPMSGGSPDGTLAAPAPQPQDSPRPVTAHTGEVIGMHGVELQVTNPDHLSVFRSAHKNLELDEGLQLMLVVMQ